MIGGNAMSSLAYGALTKKRIEQPAGASTAAGGNPGIGTNLDALAALVPAEVLALHAVIVSVVSTTGKDGTQIGDVATLRVSFWVLTAMSAGLFIVGRRSLKGWDLLRALIPPAAFVAWTMLQKTTAFDAVDPHLAGTVRTTIALFAAVLLGGLAAQLGNVADQAPAAAPEAGAGSQVVLGTVATGADATVAHTFAVTESPAEVGSGVVVAVPASSEGGVVGLRGEESLTVTPGIGQHVTQPEPVLSD